MEEENISTCFGIRLYSSTELVRMGINFNTLKGPRYVRIGNKYLKVEDIVKKFLLDNQLKDGNKESIKGTNK